MKYYNIRILLLYRHIIIITAEVYNHSAVCEQLVIGGRFIMIRGNKFWDDISKESKREITLFLCNSIVNDFFVKSINKYSRNVLQVHNILSEDFNIYSFLF